MDFSDSLGELPLSRLCSPNRTSASCPSLPRYQAACVSILCGSARAVARITCAADSGGGTRERISLRPPDPHSPWHDAITQQSGRFTGDPEVTELLPVCRPLAQNASFLAFHTANLDSWLLAQNLVSVLRRTGSADSAEHSRSSCAERPGCSKAAKWSPFFSSLSPPRRAFGRRLLHRRTP